MTHTSLLLLLCLLIPCLTHGEDKVVSAQEIRGLVVDPEPSRSWPLTRKGYQFEAGDRGWDLTRSITLVETSVMVEPDFKVSMPIRFLLGSASVLDGETSQRQLEELAKALKKARPGAKFLLEGHTCSLGERDDNNRLSLARANFVANYLIKAGVSPTILETLGCGEAEADKDGIETTAGEPALSPYRKVMLHQMMVE